MLNVLEEVKVERERQNRKWGQQDHPDACPSLLGREGGATASRLAQDIEIPTAPRAKFICNAAFRAGRGHWSAVLAEEVAEAVDAIGDDEALRMELVQVAAVAVAWIEAIDRRQAKEKA